jgi:hypothetical protein
MYPDLSRASLLMKRGKPGPEECIACPNSAAAAAATAATTAHLHREVVSG